MSGIEVVALVLGTLPLLISALEHYKEGTSRVKRWWKYGKELDFLLMDLDPQFEIYRGICETLLSKIGVEPSEIMRLLEEPGGEEWRNPELGRAMEKFLGHSYPSYLNTMDKMNRAITHLKQRLCLDAS